MPDSTTWADGEIIELQVYKNGGVDSVISETDVMGTTGSLRKSAAGTVSLRLLAGEYIDVRCFQSSNTTQNLFGAVERNYVTIKRIGN
jgi:hypothetical protein